MASKTGGAGKQGTLTAISSDGRSGMIWDVGGGLRPYQNGTEGVFDLFPAVGNRQRATQEADRRAAQQPAKQEVDQLVALAPVPVVAPTAPPVSVPVSGRSAATARETALTPLVAWLVGLVPGAPMEPMGVLAGGLWDKGYLLPSFRVGTSEAELRALLSAEALSARSGLNGAQRVKLGRAVKDQVRLGGPLQLPVVLQSVAGPELETEGFDSVEAFEPLCRLCPCPTCRPGPSWPWCCGLRELWRAVQGKGQTPAAEPKSDLVFRGLFQLLVGAVRGSEGCR
jgi:hypothetical protein